MTEATGREGKKMKTYQVFYWIKKNGREYLNHMYVAANTAKEATQVCRQQVREQTGRNAFRPTTKAPDLTAYKGNPNFAVD